MSGVLEQPAGHGSSPHGAAVLAPARRRTDPDDREDMLRLHLAGGPAGPVRTYQDRCEPAAGRVRQFPLAAAGA